MSNWKLFTSAPRYWQSWIEASPSPPVAEWIKTRCENERHFFERDPYTYMAFLRVGKIKKTIYGCQVNTGQCRCLLQVYQHHEPLLYFKRSHLKGHIIGNRMGTFRGGNDPIAKSPFFEHKDSLSDSKLRSRFPTLLMTPAPSSPRRC